MLSRSLNSCVLALAAVLSVAAWAGGDPDFRRPFQADANTVALFHFNSTADNAVSGESDGKLSGAKSDWPYTPPASESDFMAALVLGSEADSMAWKDSPKLDLPGTYTIEFWINPAGLQEYPTRFFGIIGQAYPREGPRLSHHTFIWGRRVCHRNSEGGGDAGIGESAWIATINPVLTEGVWTHVAVVNDVAGNRLQILIDGKAVPTDVFENAPERDASPHDPKDLSGDLVVGAGTFETDMASFVGAIDELRISNMARYAAQTAESMTTRLGRLRFQYEELARLIDKIDGMGLDSSYQHLAMQVGRLFTTWIEKEDIPLRRDLEVEKNVHSMELSVERAIASGRRLLVDPSLNRPVPRPDMSKLTIRDGGFFAGKEPVFLFGPVGWFSAKELEATRFQDLGYNAYEEVELGPWWMQDETTLDESRMRELKGRMDVAARENFAYGILCSPHYLPRGWADAHPDASINIGGDFFLPFCVDHPDSREMVKNYLDALVPRVKDHPYLAWYSLINEVTYWDFNDLSPCSMEKFREWLRERHGEIDALNKLWGTSYGDFSQVQPPPLDQHGLTMLERVTTPPPAEQINDAVWYDWLSFNDYRLTEFVRFGKSLIRSMDKKTPFLVETAPFPRAGGSGEAISVLADVGCTDRYDRYDLFRSFCPEKPVLDTEFHYDFTRWLPQQFFEYQTWRTVMQGCDGLMIWVWNRDKHGGESTRGIAREPEKMEGFGKAALDVRRLARLAHAFQRNPARVAIFFADPSWKGRMGFWDAFLDCKAAVNLLDAPYDIITDRLIDEGKLDGYKLLIAPRTDFVSESNFRKIADFVRRGGHAVLIGKDCLTKDAYGRPRDLRDLLRNPRVTCLPGVSMSEMDRTYERCKTSRPVRCRSAAGGPASDIEMRAMTFDGVRYAYLINHSTEDRTVQLVTDGKAITPLSELINGRPVAGPDLRLGPLDVTIYRLPGSGMRFGLPNSSDSG